MIIPLLLFIMNIAVALVNMYIVVYGEFPGAAINLLILPLNIYSAHLMLKQTAIYIRSK